MSGIGNNSLMTMKLGGMSKVKEVSSKHCYYCNFAWVLLPAPIYNSNEKRLRQGGNGETLTNSN